MTKKNYECVLVNEQGCCFDSDNFTSKKAAHKWAAERGTAVKYRANLYLDHEEIETWIPRG